LQLSTRENMIAALRPPSALPRNIQFLRPMATPRSALSAALFERIVPRNRPATHWFRMINA
jgi:hypothetical protein